MDGEMKINYDMQLVNQDTGESDTIKAGSKIIPPDRVRQMKDYALRAEQTTAEKNEAYSDTLSVRGNFFTVLCRDTELLWQNVSEPTVGKLIYLATFMDKNNRICFDGGWQKEKDGITRKARAMSKAEIQEILNVSYPTFRAFWNECVENECIIEKDGAYYLPKQMFRFCDSCNVNTKKIRMIKMFKHAIRYMYENTDERSKKTLVYLYRLIPFINLTYNALCLNPFESNKEKINALPLSKICEMFGIDPSNQTRFLKKLKKLRFVDKQGNNCSVIRYSWMYYNEDKYWVTINPQFYSGYISENDMLAMINDFRIEID